MSPLNHQLLSTPPSLLLALALGMTTAGCERGPQKFADTEGRVFESTCVEGRCTLKRIEPKEPHVTTHPKKTGVRLQRDGRVLTVCDVAPGSNVGSAPRDCRPVECGKYDCPTLPKGIQLVCERGLCVDPGAELSQEDVFALCLAGTGIPKTGEQAARLSLAYSCGSPCQKVPRQCRQP